MPKIARGCGHRGEQRHRGERVRLAVGGRSVARGEAVEDGAGGERDDLVAADLAGDGLRGARGQVGRELHARPQARRITDFGRGACGRQSRPWTRARSRPPRRPPPRATARSRTPRGPCSICSSATCPRRRCSSPTSTAASSSTASSTPARAASSACAPTSPRRWVTRSARTWPRTAPRACATTSASSRSTGRSPCSSAWTPPPTSGCRWSSPTAPASARSPRSRASSAPSSRPTSSCS